MKKLLFALLLLCLFCTCKKDQYANLCGGSDPVKNLPWLKIDTDTLKNYKSSAPIMYRFTYQNTTLFCLGSNCATCNWSPEFYDCDGNILKLTQEQSAIFMKALHSNNEVIWRAN